MLPADSFDVREQAPPNSEWANHLGYFRGSAGTRKAAVGCNVGATGTLQRSSTANQDPAFYLHHSFTFMVNDLAMQYQRSQGLSSGPFYGLDEHWASGKRECAGHNYNDVSVYSHLVPYTHGQQLGERHTWDHILRMWDFDRRHFRWVAEGEA